MRRKRRGYVKIHVAVDVRAKQAVSLDERTGVRQEVGADGARAAFEGVGVQPAARAHGRIERDWTEGLTSGEGVCGRMGLKVGGGTLFNKAAGTMEAAGEAACGFAFRVLAFMGNITYICDNGQEVDIIFKRKS
jgi:hypothetical protein